jgi:hypothetical protein
MRPHKNLVEADLVVVRVEVDGAAARLETVAVTSRVPVASLALPWPHCFPTPQGNSQNNSFHFVSHSQLMFYRANEHITAPEDPTKGTDDAAVLLQEEAKAQEAAKVQEAVTTGVQGDVQGDATEEFKKTLMS